MQNIIELTSGECEIFNKNTHLNPRVLRQSKHTFLFIQDYESASKQIRENQTSLELLLEK
jgi:hypothetical protein